MTLEETVQALKDRYDILETKYAYCRYADDNDHEGMLSVMTDDCVVDYIPGGEATLRGKTELRAMLVEFLGNVVSGWHLIGNPEFHFESADRVAVKAYMYSWQRFKGHPMTADCHRWGRYEDLFVRTDTGWKIAQLRLFSAGEYGGERIAEQFGRAFPPGFG